MHLLIKAADLYSQQELKKKKHLTFKHRLLTVLAYDL
jgi:hypothetical protein